MTDEKADELIEALKSNSRKVGALTTEIDSLYNLIKDTKIKDEFRYIGDKLDNIAAMLDQ